MACFGGLPNHVEIIALRAFSLGPDACMSIISAKDREGNTPLHLAGEAHAVNPTKIILDFEVRCLKGGMRKSDIPLLATTCNNLGETPLTLAARYVHVSLFLLVVSEARIYHTLTLWWSSVLPSPPPSAGMVQTLCFGSFCST
jgi:hypothetical protein